MRINNNISALNAFNALTINNNKFTKVIRQLSTGMRINSASDDAAGLAISETIRSKVSGLNRAMQNAQDGISLLQTAEGALGETNSMVQRMRELAVQAANDTLTSQDRSYLQMEIDALKDQIDSIARNTQFNTKSLLDGSLCGTWTSTDTTTKAYIRGSLETEGNFRIEIKADPGSAQVQKSNIFRIKHENVVTNAQLNSSNGIGQLTIEDMPAGDYTITATKPGGGEPIHTYTQTAKIEITHGNTSGSNETLKYQLVFTDNSGDSSRTVYWPDSDRPYSYKDAGTIPAYENDSEKTDDENAEAAKEAAETKIAELMKADLNGKTISIKGSDGETAEFIFTVDDELNVTAATKQDKISLQNTSFSIGAGEATVSSGIPKGYLSNTSEDASTYTANGMWSISDPASDGEFSITITDDGYTGTHKLEWGSGTSFTALNDAISALNSQVTLKNGTDTKDITLTGSMVGSSNCTFTVNGKGKAANFSSLSVDSDDVKISQVGEISKTPNDKYITTSSGAITGTNTSTDTERIYIRFKPEGYTSDYYSDVASIVVDSEDDKAAIAKKIVDAVNGKTIKFSTNKVKSDSAVLSASLDTSDTTKFTITASNSQVPVYFTLDARKANPSTKVNTASFGTATDTVEPGDVPVSAVSTLTGFYGNEGSDSLLHIDVNADTQNNASILFEVTAQAFDENGKGTITLSAQSHVLGTDGKTSNYTDSKIVVSTGAKTVDVSSLLGEAAGSVKLTIDNPAKFTAGNKFVWNVSGNGTSDAKADTSLYINSSQDSTWPYAWGDKNTYKGNTLYYNVNAEKVSNRDVNFRNYYLNSENGTVHDGEIKLTVNRDFSEKAANFPDAPEDPSTRTDEITLASFTANYVGKIAAGETKLRDIEQFWNSSGVFMLEEPQVITVSQNDGKRAQITLNESDTLNDVKNKLNDAIANGLGQGLYVKGGNANNFVTFVENSTGNNGLETVKGTFLIRSVIPGAKGELTFSSTYGSLIDSLGLNTVHESKDTSYTASVYNAHDNTLIARDIKTSDNMLKGVIDKNVDIEFSAMSAVSAVWSDSDRNFILIPDSEYYVTNLHLAKNDLNFQTGADEGDYVTLDIGNMSSEALGIKGVNVMTFERASKAITTLDNAVRYISSQRTKIGSYQNALEYAIENLTVTGTNLTSSDSRIRDTDMAKTMMEFVKFQIINQSGTSMLSQANQTARTVLNLLQ